MAGTGNSGRTPQKPSPQNGKTKPFSTVNSRSSRLAKEKQRRQYEQQKKEKMIFAAFVVIIIVLILVAILVFKNTLNNRNPDSQSDETTPNETQTVNPEGLEGFRKEMCGKEQIYTGNLILVDSAHTFKANPPELSDIYSGRTKFQETNKTVYSYYTADTTPRLSVTTLTALNQMADDFYNLTDNNDLYVNKAYDASGDHATGLAVDLSVFTLDKKLYLLDDAAASSDFEWVFANYYKYGFAMETPAQSGERHHHFRYVGVPAATYMFKQNMELEAFLTMLRDKHALEGERLDPLAVSTDDGGRYEMYYVAATDGDVTGVPVPTDAIFFEISGDNRDGYIVTARMS